MKHVKLAVCIAVTIALLAGSLSGKARIEIEKQE